MFKQKNVCQSTQDIQKAHQNRIMVSFDIPYGVSFIPFFSMCILNLYILFFFCLFSSLKIFYTQYIFSLMSPSFIIIFDTKSLFFLSMYCIFCLEFPFQLVSIHFILLKCSYYINGVRLLLYCVMLFKIIS